MFSGFNYIIIKPSELRVMVTVKILFFAKARELAGLNEDYLSIPEIIEYNTLIDLLSTKFNLNLIENNFIIALNEEYIPIGERLTLKEGNVLAIIPPLSGG